MQEPETDLFGHPVLNKEQKEFYGNERMKNMTCKVCGFVFLVPERLPERVSEKCMTPPYCEHRVMQ